MALPKLRFKAFDGGWSLTSFQDLFTFKNGVNATKEQYGSGIKFINVLDIINNPNGITYDSIIGSVNITSKEIDKNLVQYGDVLFQRSSETREEVGQSNVYLSDKPVVFGGFVIRGSAQKEYDPVFMNGLLKTDSLRDQITQLSGGSTRFNIGQDSLNKVSAYLPSKEEQSQIASFLSAVDEKITQLTQKHELLSQYKQGMMQKLFSQQIRFKADDGSEFGEWEDIQLKDFLNLTLRPISKPESNYHALGVRSHFKGLFNKYDSEPEKISMDTLYRVEKDDVVVNITFAWEGAMAIAQSEHDQGLVSHRFPTYRCDDNLVNLWFFKYRFVQKDFLSHLQLCSPGGAGRNRVLNKKAFLEITFSKPCLEEQTKIANFLSAIDQKIEKVAKQVEETKQWKQGLLQQMFV